MNTVSVHIKGEWDDTHNEEYKSRMYCVSPSYKHVKRMKGIRVDKFCIKYHIPCFILLLHLNIETNRDERFIFHL